MDMQHKIPQALGRGIFNLPVTPVFKALTKIKQIEVIVYFVEFCHLKRLEMTV